MIRQCIILFLQGQKAMGTLAEEEEDDSPLDDISEDGNEDHGIKISIKI